MKVSLSWLNDYAPFGDDADAIGDALSAIGLAVDGIDRVEIWHELGNTASGAVPARLGFTVVAEVDGDRVWRTTRVEWALVSSDA